MGGNVNPTTIQKAGKSIAPVQQICKMFEDKQLKNVPTFMTFQNLARILKIFSVLQEEQVFVPISTTRSHKSVDFKCGLLENIP